MKNVLIVGGANGVGLSLAIELEKRSEIEHIYIVDRRRLQENHMRDKFSFYEFDLRSSDYSFFDMFGDVDTLIITAGFGHLSLFGDVDEEYIIDSMHVNATAVMRIIRRFWKKIDSQADFWCAVMVSISGFMSSPFFSVYGASKAALKIFIESVNVELEKSGSVNKILNVSPGSIKGTSFTSACTDLSQIHDLSCDIINHIEAKDDLFIPHYDDIYRDVLERYHQDFREEGRHSYEYKLNSGRVKIKGKL